MADILCLEVGVFEGYLEGLATQYPKMEENLAKLRQVLVDSPVALMENLMTEHDQAIIEKLRRRLLSGYTEPDELCVSSYIENVVLPLLCELGMADLFVTVAPKIGRSVFYSTSVSPSLTDNDVTALISCMTCIKSSRFVVEKASTSLIGYSGDELDWVIIGVPDAFRKIGEEIVDSLWYQFFENV